MKPVAALPDAERLATAVAPALLAWYDRHRRALPWRSPPGAPSDPYRVWLSEIMLQQTTVAAVKPYYAAFLAAWPSVDALSAAPLDAVLKAWAGLGYYSRARNLHACARTVAEGHDGRFPADEAALRGLPGIGRYTAAAIAAIAFGQRAVVVDGNVERVMARLFAIDTPLPRAKPMLHAAMDAVTPAERTGDFAQAAMDLGATICTPRTPACGLCPLAPVCRARRDGTAATLPRKEARKAVPQRGGAVLVARRPDGAVLVRRRPASGLFGGMTEFPGTAWREGFDPDAEPDWVDDLAAIAVDACRIGAVQHGLTHFSLTLQVYLADSMLSEPPAGMRWVGANDLVAEALPTLMRKVAALASTGLDRSSSGGLQPDGAAAPDLFGPERPVSPGRTAPEPAGPRRHRRPRLERRRTAL